MKGCGALLRYCHSDYVKCGKDYGDPIGIIYCNKCRESMTHDTVLAEVRALRERVSKLTDIIDWMSNGYGAKQMELEYDIEMAEVSEHFS